MIKELLKDSILYTIPSIVSRSLGFLLLPIFTRIISPTDYGALDLITIYGAFINILVPLEITQAMARFYYETDEKAVIVKTSFLFTFFSSTLFLIFSVVNSELITKLLLKDEKYIQTLKIGLIYIYLNIFFYFIQNLLRWDFKSKFFLLSSLSYSIIYSLASVLLANNFKLGINGILFGIILGTLIGLIIGFIPVRKLFVSSNFDFILLKKMLIFSIPIVFSSISVVVYQWIDRYMISTLLSLRDVGIYGVAARISTVTYFPLIGIQMALTPLVYKYYEKSDTPIKISKIFSSICFLIFIVITFITIFRNEIILFFAPKEYSFAGNLLLFLPLSNVLFQLYIFSPGIWICKKTYLIFIINLLSALTNTILNYILIKFLGIIGAGLATLITAFMFFAIYVFFNQKFYTIPYEWKNILSALLIIFITIIFLEYIYVIIHSFILKFIMFSIIVLVLLNLKLLKIDELMKILKDA